MAEIRVFVAEMQIFGAPLFSWPGNWHQVGRAVPGGAVRDPSAWQRNLLEGNGTGGFNGIDWDI